MEYRPKDWLITFSDFKDGQGNPFGDGRPFGDGTEMANRFGSQPPWDEGCIVKPLIGGYETMKEIREAFESVIKEAEQPGAPPFGRRGHVYIAGWRLNPNRDMSENVDPWQESSPQHEEGTAFGLIRRMMEAGVKIRVLLWLPPDVYQFEEHRKAHIYTAKLIQELNQQLRSRMPQADRNSDLGVVLLDRRLAERVAFRASHHQKFIVARGLETNVAFCGGVDLAYTRRDAPVFCGDWQSGSNIPPHFYQVENTVNMISEGQMGPDLPEAYEAESDERHIWHDQHLRLQGPIVATLEHAFAARWCSPPLKSDYHLVLSREVEQVEDVPLNRAGSVISSSESAFSEVEITREFATTDIDIIIDNHDIVKGSLEVWDDYGIIDVASEPMPDRVWFEPSPPKLRFKYRHQDRKITVKYRKLIIAPLPEPEPVDRIVDSRSAIVQPWQTIPLRKEALGDYSKVTPDAQGKRPTVRYMRGEFSVMAGLLKPSQRAQQMILIFDQYFWSVPYAKLLASELGKRNSLHSIIVLPPISDQLFFMQARCQHRLRQRALLELDQDGIRDRVRVYSLWNGRSEENGGRGIYCHAKVQLFDDALLVCGSSNINRRSYTVDTELACAVLNRGVVQDHYKSLWEYLFSRPFPTDIAFAEDELWGKKLFEKFHEAHSQTEDPEPRTYLDPWRVDRVQLPNNAVRENILPSQEVGLILINDPSGLSLGAGRPAKTTSLSDIVERIEGPDSEVFRRQ